MGTSERLRVHVNDELVLDAGTYEEVSGPHGPENLIRPPETTLFHQVLTYLRAQPDPPTPPSGSMGVAPGTHAGGAALRLDITPRTRVASRSVSLRTPRGRSSALCLRR